MSDKGQILLVDDVEENLVAMEALLRRDDIEIVCARSGTDALERILEREFSLALIDVQMPQMDGFELAELMRGAERSKYIPIIFVTAGARDAQRVFRGYETGAVDFLFKPVDAHVLRHKVDTFVRLDFQKRQLKRMAQQLEEAVQAREDVLAVVSHDMRNFLQAIKSGNAMLAKRTLSDDVKQTIHARIAVTVDLMTRMITDLMDMANIRAGRISVTPRPEVLNTLVLEALSVHQPLAQEKGIQLQSELPPENIVVQCDRERILQVFANLLGNSLKFCKPGDSICIRVDSDLQHAHLIVADSGPGIAPDDLPNVCNAYWSGARNTQRGTGLGLYITKRVIEAHDSDVIVESEVGRGTRVRFTLSRSR